MKQQILAQPPAVYNHGWIPAPASLHSFRQMLDPISSGDHSQVKMIPGLSFFDIFTEGSCWGPRGCLTRIASWGLVVADMIGPHDFFPVQSGLLPGRFQSVTRAELYAAIQAVKIAVQLQLPFRLWIDNQYVVRKVRFFAACRKYEANVNKPNHDLLQSLHEAMQKGLHLYKGVVKVYSHQNMDMLHNPFETVVFQAIKPLMPLLRMNSLTTLKSSVREASSLMKLPTLNPCETPSTLYWSRLVAWLCLEKSFTPRKKPEKIREEICSLRQIKCNHGFFPRSCQSMLTIT